MGMHTPDNTGEADRSCDIPERWEREKENRTDVLDVESLVAESGGTEPSTYFPEQDGKAVPEEGAWIIVVEEPFTELRSRFRIPLLSMWRARPHTVNTGAIVSKGVKIYPKQAVITTPGGDLHLWPHEYVVVRSPMMLAGDIQATLHSLDGRPVLDEDALFYLMSRGISRHQAVKALLEATTSLDHVYVTFPERITDSLAGAGQSLRRHMALNPREPVL
ncbi:hypothetical protein ACWF2L_24345 [Streptomyces anulatus]